MNAHVRDLMCLSISERLIVSIFGQQGLRTEDPPLDPCSLDDFQLGPVLGTGSFGRVSLARHRPTSTICAVKALSKAHIVKHQQVNDRLVSLIDFSEDYITYTYAKASGKEQGLLQGNFAVK